MEKDLFEKVGKLINLGVEKREAFNFEPAIAYFEEALEIVQTQKKETEKNIETHKKWQFQEARIVNGLALTYQAQGKLNLAVMYFMEGIELLDGLEGNEKGLAVSYNSLGNTFIQIKDYKSSKEYFTKALKINEKLKDKEIAGIVYNGLGEIFYKEKNYKEALEFFHKAKKIKEDDGERGRRKLFTTYSKMGYLFFDIGDLDKAEEVFTKALSLSLEHKDTVKEIVSLMYLGKLNLAQKRTDVAETYLMNALAKMKNIDEPDWRDTFALTLKKLYVQKGDYKKALFYAEEYNKHREDIVGQNMMTQLVEVDAKYKISEAKKDIEREKKAKEQIKTVVKDLNHRIKNNFQILIKLFKDQEVILKDKVAAKTALNGRLMVESMMKIHSSLYGENVDITTIDMEAFIYEIIEDLKLTYQLWEKSIDYDLDIEEKLELDVKTAIPICLILNELVSNALKHAFNNHPNPQLQVVLKYDKDTNKNKVLKLTIADNGPINAFDFDQVFDGSYGLQLVKKFTQELNGEISPKVKVLGGLKWDFVFPNN